MDLLCISIFYQCLVGFLLNLIINLFFQTLSLLILIFCMMMWNIWPVFIMYSFIFINIIIKINHLYFITCYHQNVLCKYSHPSIINHFLCKYSHPSIICYFLCKYSHPSIISHFLCKYSHPSIISYSAQVFFHM